MSQVIPFPRPSKISAQDLDAIKNAVEKAVLAHQVLADYVEDICADSRLEHLGREELAEIITAMLQQQDEQ